MFWRADPHSVKKIPARSGAGVSLLLVLAALLAAGCGGGDDQEQVQAEQPRSLVPANLDSLVEETGVDTMAVAGSEGTIGAARDVTEQGEPVQAVPEPVQETLQTTETAATPTRTPAAPAVGSGEFSLQVGSFRQAANAGELAGKIRELGYPATVEAAVVGGLDYNRVFIRGLADRAAAENLGEELRASLGINYLVLRKP